MRSVTAIMGALTCLSLSTVLWAEEPAAITSGCEVGANTPVFKVTDVTGPYKGQTICYV